MSIFLINGVNLFIEHLQTSCLCHNVPYLLYASRSYYYLFVEIFVTFGFSCWLYFFQWLNVTVRNSIVLVYIFFFKQQGYNHYLCIHVYYKRKVTRYETYMCIIKSFTKIPSSFTHIYFTALSLNKVLNVLHVPSIVTCLCFDLYKCVASLFIVCLVYFQS